MVAQPVDSAAEAGPSGRATRRTRGAPRVLRVAVGVCVCVGVCVLVQNGWNLQQAQAAHMRVKPSAGWGVNLRGACTPGCGVSCLYHTLPW